MYWIQFCISYRFCRYVQRHIKVGFVIFSLRRLLRFTFYQFLYFTVLLRQIPSDSTQKKIINEANSILFINT